MLNKLEPKHGSGRVVTRFARVSPDEAGQDLMRHTMAYMRQAIQTRYFGPSNVKGSRVKAFAQAGSVTLHWDHALNPEQNHTKAAEAYAKKMQWRGLWFGGALPSGDYAFVQADGHADVAFEVVVSEAGQ